MNVSGEHRSMDEYNMMAQEIFEYCGAPITGTLQVDTLMDKFAPFIKMNKSECRSEYNYLKSLLDPDHSNPEVNIAKLAYVLGQYSENSKVKVDLDESFNLRTGQTTQDSDSGISTDGYQLLEDLQCELREKSHLASQLRLQLDLSDRHHEEALAAVTAERDALRAHLNVVREENSALHDLRRDYEEASERLCSASAEVEETRRELEGARRRNGQLEERVALLQAEKETLQELLTKSKDECHRINEMYKTRQSTLLGQNEALKGDHSELSARLQDQEELVQQLMRDKVLLEMELKDMLNRSNQTQLRLDRSIDISYTEDQMLTALDSLTADSRFTSDNRILDEESFTLALKEEQGRATNMSLFDEIRLSFCNNSRPDVTDLIKEDSLDTSLITVATQTDEGFDDFGPFSNNNNVDICNDCTNNSTNTETLKCKVIELENELELSKNVIKTCKNCDMLSKEIEDLKTDIIKSTNIKAICSDCEELSNKIKQLEANLVSLKNIKTECNDCHLFKNKIKDLETDIINSKNIQAICNNCDLLGEKIKDLEVNSNNFINNKANCSDCERLKYKIKNLETDLLNTNNLKGTCNNCELLIDKIKDLETYLINIQKTKTKCLDCDKNRTLINTLELDLKTSQHNLTKKGIQCDLLKKQIVDLETDLNNSQKNNKELKFELDKCENSLDELQKYIEDGEVKNMHLEAIATSLESKIGILEQSCIDQRDRIDGLISEASGVEYQIKSDQVTVATQADVPCVECEKGSVAPTSRALKRFLWDPLKCLFQVFAVACFVCAVGALWAVPRAREARCGRAAVPWRWLHLHDLMDLLLRVEYVADVPM